jgi:hypothetical protein
MTLELLKTKIDLHDLAGRLGLKRPDSKGNYRSPHHADKTPSLSIYHRNNEQRWKDWSDGDKVGGTCIDLVMYILGLDVAAAIDWLRDQYNIARPVQSTPEKPKAKPSLAEFIADKCIRQAAQVKDYLQGRGISPAVIEQAIKCKSVGFNSYTSDKNNPGEVGHGGPAAAFIVRTMNPGHIVAVDLRFINPELNGGVKTQCQGEKLGHVWFMDLAELKAAETVYVVESPINVLSIASCGLYKTAAVAVRGVMIDDKDWSFLTGKRVIICMDADQPDEHGKRPGPEAAWRLYETLTDRRITAILLDQSDWIHHSWNDVNDILATKPEGNIEELKRRLRKLESWSIAGLSGSIETGRKRLWLPEHDFLTYWKYRVREDFTQVVSLSMEEDEESGERQKVERKEDLCGFRIAALTRVNVASAQSTMTGKADNNPEMLMALSVQTPRHGNQLLRKVVQDDKLHNADMWGRIGPIFKKPAFLRLINILERSAALGQRTASNFVGVCWRNGELVVNEGPDTFFTDPHKQCPYHNLLFPSGSVDQSATVIYAYQATFSRNAALIPLVWGLGAHLKTIIGFWPHMMMQANKGAGKSTLIKQMEQTIGFTMFSGQSLQTEFRLLTSVSHTSHPVGWEEISARRQDVIDKAVAMLQESYQYTVTRRGSDMTEFVLSAPVLLAGEDVPVRSLIGKIIRTDLTGKKGAMLPPGLPEFPVKQWLGYLVKKDRAAIHDSMNKARAYCFDNCRAPADDDGARRMVENYSAVLTAWKLLCDFSGIDPRQGGFVDDLLAEMNAHIAETDADREPWVWIIEMALSEIDAGRFNHPYKYEVMDTNGIGELCLLIRPGHIIDHIAHTPALRERWNALPIKSPQALAKQLNASGVIVKSGLERIISAKRMAHLDALSTNRLETFGLYASPNHFDND